MHSVVVVEYTGHEEYHELLNRQAAGNSRHRQHFLRSSLSNNKLIQILYKLLNTLRQILHMDENLGLLDEGSEAPTCGHLTLPRVSKHISPGS